MILYNVMWIVLSALLYALAFVVPDYCFWFVFIFLIPLYWFVATHPHLSVWSYGIQGFVWGSIFFSIHMYAILRLCIEKTNGRDAWSMWALLLGYCASISACFFASASFVGKRTASRTALLCVWVVATWCYIEYIDRFLFRCISLPKGYVFAYPLLALAQHPKLLMALYYVPAPLLLFCMYTSCVALVYFLLTKNKYACILFFVCLLPYLVPCLYPSKKAYFPYKDSFIHVAPPAYTAHATELDRAQEINEQIQRALQKYPEASCLFFPESTYPFLLDQALDMYQLWKDNALSFGQHVTIVMGAHNSGKQQTTAHNTVFVTGYRFPLLAILNTASTTYLMIVFMHAFTFFNGNHKLYKTCAYHSAYKDKSNSFVM